MHYARWATVTLRSIGAATVAGTCGLILWFPRHVCPALLGYPTVTHHSGWKQQYPIQKQHRCSNTQKYMRSTQKQNITYRHLKMNIHFGLTVRAPPLFWWTPLPPPPHAELCPPFNATPCRRSDCVADVIRGPYVVSPWGMAPRCLFSCRETAPMKAMCLRCVTPQRGLAVPVQGPGTVACPWARALQVLCGIGACRCGCGCSPSFPQGAGWGGGLVQLCTLVGKSPSQHRGSQWRPFGLCPRFGDPREHRGHVAIAPTFGPQESRGYATTFDCVPFVGDP